MAVDIPVVIDIDKAFQDAAARVGAAIKPLQRQVDANTLKLDIVVGTDDEGEAISMKFKEIKESGVKDMAMLRNAINSVNLELVEAAQSGDKVKFTALLEAKHYMEDMVRASQIAKHEIDGLASTMQGLSARIQSARERLETTRIGSSEWEKAAEELRKVSVEAENVERRLAEMGTRTGSLDQLNIKLQELEHRWSAMGSGAMFTESGGLTTAAQKIQDEYTKIATKIEQQNKLLTAQIDKQKEAEQAAKRKASEEEREINAYIAAEERREAAERKHREDLALNARSLNDLNTKLRAWQEELNASDMGSAKWTAAATEVASLSQQIKTVTDALSQIGVNSRSIDGLNAKIQQLNKEWSQMSVYTKYTEIDFKEMTPEARAIYEEYKKSVDALRQHGQTLDQILQKEQQRAQLTQQGAQKRRYENAILNASVKSIRVLQEQERILSDRLNRTQIGSSKYERLRKELEAVRRELNKINGKSIKELGDEADRSNSKLANLIKNSLRLVALHAGTRFVRNIREVTAEFELQKVALGSIIQDTARAQSLFREIKTAAIQSPFQIKDLVSYTKQLSAYQIETDKLFSTTMKLADISAGLGVDMGRLILAFGQVRAASVLRGQELRQFTEAGIPLVDKLAEKFSELNNRTVTTAEVFELISKRAVSFSMIEEIFNDMTDAGGIFYKMQEKQAETLAGQWANLKDSLSIMYDEIGRTDAVHGAMTTLIKDARWLFQNWRKWAGIIKVAGSALISYVAISKAVAAWTAIVAKAEQLAAAAASTREINTKRLITSIIGKAAAEKIAALSANAYAAATARAAAANSTFAKTFWNLTAAMAKNPFGLLAIAIGGAIAGLISLKNKVYDVEKAISDADASIKALRKNREETTKLIDSYEELSKKTNLSEKEQRRLKDTSRELAKAFPKATEAIDQNTGALILNIQKLRDYSEASRAVVESGIRAEIKENEKAIKKNEKQISRIEKVNKRGWGFATGGLFLSGIFGDFSNKDAMRMSNHLQKLGDDTQALKDKNVELNDALNGVFATIDDAPTVLPPFDDGHGGTQDRLEGLKNEIKDITDAYKKFIELLEFESKEAAQADIDILFPSLQGWEPNYQNMLTRMGELLNQYSGDAEATRLIQQAITNIRFDKIKSDLKEALAKLKDDIKRSEEARNFYKDIFDLTGDNDIATNLSISVYGDVGKDLGDRLKESLQRTLKEYNYAEDSDIFKTLTESAENLDFREVMKNIGQVPKELRSAVKEAAGVVEKYNSDIAKSYAKLLNKYDEIEQQRVNIKNQAAKDIEAIEEGLKRQLKGIQENAAIEDKEAAEKAARQRAEAAKAGVISERDLGLKRLERDYRMFFSSVGVISLQSARKIARTQKEMITQQFNAGQKTLAQYKREIREIDEQLKKYEQNKGILVTYLTGGTDAAIDKLSEFSDGLLAIADSAFDKKNGTWLMNDEDRAYIDKLGKIFGGEIFGVSGRNNIFEQLIKVNEGDPKKLEKALEGAAEAIKEMGSNMSQAMSWADFWVHLAGGAIKSLDEVAGKSKNVSGEVAWGWNLAADAFLKAFTLGTSKRDDAWDRLTALNEKAMSGFEKFKSGDILGALIDNIYGWSEVWGKSTKAVDRQIKQQSDLIDDLQYQYDRLGVAMEDAFGEDYIYNYNQQMEILQAQAEAYRKQAELERSKGKKKADEEKAKEYEKSARDIEDQIADARSQLSEFFAGTDVTSAAQDFAKAWIEAYKEFGSTTSAMREKFDEMIENMVVNSLAAKLIQGILEPIFKEIQTAAEDGSLGAGDIARISAMVPEKIAQINAAMSTMTNELTAAGINLRQQAGQFTGISRDIAGASEESILGLAAGVNTANFYMSHIPAISENVAALRAFLVGDSAQTVRTTASEGPTYEDQMLGYVSMLPLMRDDTNAIRSLLEKVIKPVGTAYYVSVR